MMAVQTAWIYIHIHTEAKGATFISEHLQEITCAAPHPDPDLWQMEKTNLVLQQEKVITSITNHNIITAVRQGTRLRLTEAPVERNVISTLTASKGKERFVQHEQTTKCTKAENSSGRLGDMSKKKWDMEHLESLVSLSHHFKANPAHSGTRCCYQLAAQELMQNQQFRLNIWSPTTIL